MDFVRILESYFFLGEFVHHLALRNNDIIFIPQNIPVIENAIRIQIWTLKKIKIISTV